MGFDTAAGTEFQFVAKPKPGWDGIVNCVILEARAPSLLRFSWTDNGGGDQTEVAYRLDPTADGGTRLVYEHTGFTGVGGFFMARLLERVRRTMLRVGLPRVLADLDQGLSGGEDQAVRRRARRRARAGPRPRDCRARRCR